MSLHLGNLPSRIRRDDLVHVFRRFGRCTVQVKDRYGFVVYDYPASAEKALKTLKGKRICGEAITLSWSNRQPHAMPRFPGGGKSYAKQQRRKYPVRENADRMLGTNDQQDHEADFKHTDGEVRKVGSSNLSGESAGFYPNDLEGHVGEKDHSSLNIHLEDDRWEEQVLDPPNENLSENGTGFDRYDPYQSDDKKESDENHNTSPSTGPPNIRKPLERTETERNDRLKMFDHLQNPKSQRACFGCGQVGHKMHNCPLKLKRQTRRPTSHPVNDREPSTSRNGRRFLKQVDSPRPYIIREATEKDSRDKRRTKRDYEIQDKNHSKRRRGPSSSSLHSDYTISRSGSPSRSLEAFSRSPSHSDSKLAPLKKKSMSSSSRSSASDHSRFKTRKSRFTSRSISPKSSSLPVQRDTHFSPSPNGKQTNSRDPVVNVIGPSSIEDLFEGETPEINNAGPSKSDNITAAVEDECEASPSKLEADEMKKDSYQEDNHHFLSVGRFSGKVLESDIPHSNENDQSADNLLVQVVKENGDSQNLDMVGQDASAPGSDVPLKCNSSHSAGLSSEEIFSVLKHYDLHYPEENEMNLPADIYFGSARSWPWEIVYYRRLKKGPISAENYARRIAQNEEFGIVDKYIRGSSGWGELNGEYS